MYIIWRRKELQAKLLAYKVTLKEMREIPEKLDETVIESIEIDAEIDEEIQEDADLREFLQKACTEIDIYFKEYVRNEQPEHLGNSRSRRHLSYFFTFK